MNEPASDLTMPLPLRLMPGDDLRRALEAAGADEGCSAAFVLSGVGSQAIDITARAAAALALHTRHRPGNRLPRAGAAPRRLSRFGPTRDVLDNREFLHSKLPMTGPDHPNLPQGYVQLTEGRVRTTDLVFGKTSTVWTEPHAFVVSSAVGEDGIKVARRMPAESKSARVRS
jgi:hypothetical protein